MSTSTNQRQAPGNFACANPQLQKHQSTCLVAAKRQHRQSSNNSLGSMRLIGLLACSISVLLCLMPNDCQVECGRLQEFIQNLVGGAGSSSNSNNSNKENNSNNNNNQNDNSNSNSNSNSDSSGDSDSSASGSSDSSDQQMTPMMSAMSPFMRYPSFYDFGFGGSFPGMSYGNPMGSMSAMSPMAAMSTNQLGAFGGHANSGAFGAGLGTAFGGAGTGVMGAFGIGSANPMAAFAAGHHHHSAGPSGGGSGGGMSASTLSNVYAAAAGQPSLMGAYTPYYGRRR